MKIVLASGSYQRQRLLSMMGVEFAIIQSGFDEHLIQQSDFHDLGDYVSAIAAGKVMEVAGRLPPSEPIIILGGDLLCFNTQNKALGKPSTLTKAREYLNQLSGNWHHEVSAVTIWSQSQGLERTVDHIDLFLPTLSENEKKVYLQESSPLEKAGGFSLATYAKILTKRGEDPRQNLIIRGSLTGVLGFPIKSVAQILEKYDYSVPVDVNRLEKKLEDDILAGRPL